MLTFVRALILAVVATVAMYLIPVPYVLRAPGRAVPATPMVHILDRPTYPSRGQLLITTVLIEPASILTCLYSAMEPASELIPKTDYLNVQERSDGGADVPMAISHLTSQIAALRYLGYKIHLLPLGVRVTEVVPGKPAYGVLQPGDLITGVDGHRIHTMEELQIAVRGSQGKVKVRLERGGQVLEFSLKPKGQVLGLAGRTEPAPAELPVRIQIESGGIAGSSAGLIFSLDIVDQLTPDDLTGGRIIAGTGTITPDGRVLSISGARFKAVAAERAGASIFFCPKNDAQEALAANTRLKIVPVGTLQEAVDALASLSGANP